MPQSVWVKTGALQWWCDWNPHKWVDVRVALEQFTGLDGARDSILFIYYVVHEEKKVRGGSREKGTPGTGTQAPQVLGGGRVQPVVTAAPAVGGRCGGPPCCSLTEPPAAPGISEEKSASEVEPLSPPRTGV